MKAAIYLMCAGVLMASTAYAQAPAAPAEGQKVPLSEGSSAIVQHAEDEPH